MAVAERDYILDGATPVERDYIVHGLDGAESERFYVLRGFVQSYGERDYILEGKPGFERDYILDTKALIERQYVLDAEDPAQIFIRYAFREEEIENFIITSGQLVNEVTIRYGYDFAEGKYKSALTKHNPLSKLVYGEARKSFDLKMIQKARQAEKIADAILMTSSIPEILCSFKHDLRSLYVEVGDVVSISHLAGLGENGYQNALGLVSRKNLNGIEIDYQLSMKSTGKLYMSELLTLTQTSDAGTGGVTITYEHGVATITIYADVQGYPPVEGAEVTISGVKKITDVKGQVRFNLEPGTYTAGITASGYEDAEVTFTV